MKIAIIGAGFTGLSAAYKLIKQNHEVVVFEKDNRPGGLAIGYKEKEWDWSLEKHYHHWFTNDYAVLNLAKEINYKVLIRRPKTSVLINDKIFQLDSPLSVLSFPLLSLNESLRMGFCLAFLKLNPFWKPLEKYKASEILPKFMGKRSYEMIWEPLLINKFGIFSDNISLAWFWARIKKRTQSLAYPKGGFLEFANKLAEVIKKKGGKFNYNTEIINISSNSKPEIKFQKNENGKIGVPEIEKFDKVIVTVPSFLFLKFAPDLPREYKNNLGKLKGLGATNLILRLKKPFFAENTYWLNICNKNSPIMAIVEHTNFMDNKNYNGEHIVYLGNYRPMDDSYFLMTKEEMLSKFTPLLKKINKDFSKNIIAYELFKAPFAQPVIPVNYSRMIPQFRTPLKNVFLANIQQVYPWDRGTNYAVELGEKVADLLYESS